MGAVLGVSAFRYLPFAIFCYASPALSVLYGITGFKIEKTAPPAPGQPGIQAHEPATAGPSPDGPALEGQEAGE
jgi:NhaC family Na+:H+ antiporter